MIVFGFVIHFRMYDRNGNELEVGLFKQQGKAYFTWGWSLLGTLHNLGKGIWIKMFYLERIVVYMEIFYKYMREIEYPKAKFHFKLPDIMELAFIPFLLEEVHFLLQIIM